VDVVEDLPQPLDDVAGLTHFERMPRWSRPAVARPRSCSPTMGQVVTDGRLEVTALGDEVNECARME
jgi:hypothetical protein